MCPPWAAPPAADSCLDYPDCATAKRGGTEIRPEVRSIEEHDRWIDEGRYCPAACRCGGSLQGHGTRTRTLAGALGALGEMVPALVILIAVFRCSECGGIWRVLPGKSDKQEILVLDEAHRLPRESLNELRLISNLDFDRTPPFTLILAGQPPLRERLAEPNLASLWQRLPLRASLSPLSDRETVDYLDPPAPPPRLPPH